MKRKNYKVGDRIFYECYDGTIGTGIVSRIREEHYTDGNGKEISYKWLSLYNSLCGIIEDYNCLPYSDPRVKELAKKYKVFDKKKDEIIDSIIEIISPFGKELQRDILELLELKI